MDSTTNTQDETGRRWRLGLLVSAVLIAIGIIASALLREAGRPPALALIVMVVFNLAGALVMDLYGRRDGAVLAAMGLLMLLSSLPLLWVGDRAAWMRENPLTLGFTVILAAYVLPGSKRSWPLFAVAAILGAAHILASLI